MVGRLVSPLGISVVPLAIIGGIHGVLGVVVWSTGPPHARWMFLIPLVMFVGVQLVAAGALARAVQVFADTVQAEGAPPPVVDASRDGDVVVQWPDWGLAVGGTVSRFHVRHFSVQVGVDHVPLRLAGAREGARAALHLAGRGGGAVGDYDGHLPGALGLAPFVAVGVGGGLAGVLVAMVLPDGLGVAVGVAVACAALSALLLGHATHRREMRAFLAGLRAEGVRVDRPICVWNGFSPRYVVPTSAGAFLVGWLSLWRVRRFFVLKDGLDWPGAAFHRAAQ